MTGQMLLRALLLAFCLDAAGLVSGLVNTPLVQALADDDDDDGGDDDDDDDGGGWSGDDDADEPNWGGGDLPQAGRRAPPRSAPPPPPPARASDQIIIGDLDAVGRAALLGAGFELLADADRLSLLGVPQGLSVEAALIVVGELAPGLLAAPNDFYRHQACEAEICASWSQVGWMPAEDASCHFSPFIGVVDSGINLEHAMLAGADITLERMVDGEAMPSELKHGTAVVAMIAGAADSRVPGLAPGARLHVVDPFARAGGDERADAFGLIRALDRLVEAGVDAINLSLAGPHNPLLEAAVARADVAGIALVAAAGNAGPRSTPLFPAGYPSVVAVSAVDGDGAIYRRAVQGDHVDFVAPGVAIPTAASISGIRLQTGTSFATPFVTVAIAAARHLGEADPVAYLAGLSEDLGAPGHDPVFGWGLVQMPDPCAALS